MTTPATSTARPRLLLLTDLPAGAAESAVDGVFRRELRRHFEVDVVFHDRDAREVRRIQDTVVVPKRALRGGILPALREVADPAAADFIIVRNKYYLLGQCLDVPCRGRVGFWETFPHSFRRLADAEQEGRAVFRKRIEYAWRRWSEDRLLRRTAFFLPITARHAREFHPAVAVPVSPLPMGIDPALFPATAPSPQRPAFGGSLRFVYTGTVDALRRVDVLNAVFHAAPGDFRLDYYTFSDNPTVAALRACGDPRIQLHPALPRPELVEALRGADVGLGYVPPVRTYIGSSPTKTLEYAALGLTIMANRLPDYDDWLDPGAAIFTEFEPTAIRAGLDQILATPREALAARGALAAHGARQNRSYAVLADRLAAFLTGL